MTSCAVMLIMLLPWGDDMAAIPDELTRALRARTFRNGSMTYYVRFADGHVGRDQQAQFTEREYLLKMTGKPVNGAASQRLLLSYGGKWLLGHDIATLVMNMTDERPSSGFQDVRSAGLTPNGVCTDAPADVFTFPQDTRFDRTERDGHVLITAARPGSGTRDRWWIDPTRGWSVVRCQRLSQDAVVEECVCRMQRVGDAWFPSSVEVFCSGHNGGLTPQLAWTFDDVRLDDPRLPRVLTPVEIGADVGTNIHYVRPGGNQLLSWDGERLDSYASIVQRIERGTLKRGERFAARLAEQQAAMSARVIHTTEFGHPLELTAPSRWEEYVEQFIARCALDEDQRQKALTILGQCQAEAARHLGGREAELARMAALGLSINAADSPEAQRELRAELTALRAGVRDALTRVFEQRLRPGLVRLLTRKQSQTYEAEKAKAARRP